MPVRYAVAPLDKKLPGVAAPLKVEDAAISVGQGKPQDIKLQGSAQYTTRLMRSGYLYVYDEKRDHMDAYWSTREGYFMRIVQGSAVPVGAQNAKPCNDNGHPELAGCIAIVDAQNTGTLWLGYSDVQWTEAIIDAHRGAAGKHLRTLHMRAFDAGAWAKAHRQTPGQPAKAGRGSIPHTVPMSELAGTVAEFAPTAPNMPTGFLPPSAPDYHLRAGKAAATQEVFARRSPGLQGAIIALDDPAGIAQDLAALIHWHQEKLLDTRVAKDKYGNGYGSYDTTYRELVALRGAIETLKETNDEKVKLQVFSNANDLADYMKVSHEATREHEAMLAVTPALATRPAIPGTFAKPPSAVEQARQKELDELMRNPSPEKIKIAQETAWKDYLGKLKPGPRNQWAGEFKTASDALQTHHIEPLAKAHAAWMQSNQLANKLESTHDGNDALSGDVYAATLSRCMVATQDIGGCKELYVRWLQGDIGDKTNLLLRGLALRQDELIKSMAAAPLDPKNISWQTLFDQYAEHIKVLLKPSASMVGNALEMQATAAKAKEQYDNAAKLAATVDSDYHMVGMRRDVQAKLRAAEAEFKTAEQSAEQARQAAGKKLLPDAVAALIAAVTGPLATALHEYNKNAAATAIARWMTIVGVCLRTPVGVVDVSGRVVESIEITSRILMDNMQVAATQSGKSLTKSQVRQLTSYAQRQVKSAFASGSLGTFEARTANGVHTKFAAFLTPEIMEELAKTKGHNQKINHLLAAIKTPKNLHDYGVLRVATRPPLHSAISEGILTVVDTFFKLAGWTKMLEDEAKALNFQKTRQQDWRETMGAMLFYGAIVTGLGNVTKIYGTWRNLYAAGMAERAAQATAAQKLVAKAEFALKVTGVVTAGISGVVAIFDFVDAYESHKQGKWDLRRLQIISGGVGLTAAVLAGWAAAAELGGATPFLWFTLTWWGLILAVVLVVLALAIDAVKSDNIKQWLERTYWGTLESGRYTEARAERKGFETMMAGASPA
jgi:hypothetical protein